MFVEVLLIIVVLLCAFEYFTKYSRIGYYVNKIPGPKAWPILGNVPQLFTTPEKLFKLLTKWDVEYYPIYRGWLANKAFISIIHPDDLEKVFSSTKHIEKSIFYNPLRGWLGDGLLISHGGKWHQRRKMLTPAFHFNILRQYYESMLEHGEQTMKTLKSNGQVTCNITKLACNFTLDVICETAMGVNPSDEEFSTQYREGIHNVGAATIYRITNPLLMSETLFRLSHKGQKYKESLKILHDFTKKILKERKEYHEKTNYQFLNEFSTSDSKKNLADDVYCGYRKKRLAMLDLLIAEQREGRIDDEGIQEELDTFTFEGHDTSGMTLSYAVLLIAEHADAQSRIRDEITQVLDESEGKLGISEIQRLSYLDMCLKECLRLYPIVPFISRCINEDLQLKNYLVPKGSIVLLPAYSVHRIPEYWPDPEKFNPERFLPENAKARHPYSYIPFSAGPRNCIGQKFAILELKLFLILLIKNFHVKPITTTQELRFVSDLVLRTTDPIRVKLVPIEE